MEALCLQIEQFSEWCAIQGIQLDINQLKDRMLGLHRRCDAESYAAQKSCGAFVKLHDLFTDYLKSLTLPMATFWQSYIDMVLLLLQFIQATRQGICELNKACIQDMLS